jgi:hypothetical protein
MKNLKTLLATTAVIAATYAFCACAPMGKYAARRAGYTNWPPGAPPPLQVDPAAKDLVEHIGDSFGPLGAATAKCGVAIAALALSFYNHRRFKSFLKDKHPDLIKPKGYEAVRNSANRQGA